MPGYYRFLKSALDPLAMAACLGMALSGFYMIYLGLWQSLGSGFLFFIMAPIFLPMFILPAGFLSGAMQLATHFQKPKWEKVLGAMALGWLIAMPSFYTATVYELLTDLFYGDFILPTATWAGFASLAPWAIFARNDKDNMLFTSIIFFLAIGLMVLIWMNTHGMADSFGRRFFTIYGVITILYLVQKKYDDLLVKRAARDPDAPKVVTVNPEDITIHEEDKLP